MAGNSQRRGAMRNPGSKKGATVGSGGQRRKGLQGKGPTPKATERAHHPAARRERAAAKRAEKAGGKPGAKTESRGRRPAGRTEASLLSGRNAVVEALRAEVPAKSLYVQARLAADDRWREALSLAVSRGIPVLEVDRTELDRMTDGAVHQGLVLTVPAYEYADLDDLQNSTLLVALDGITDPRNLGAIARSGAAFGAGGVILPTRRSVGVTAAAWKASAGAFARVPVAQVTNLTRSLDALKDSGFMVVGLDAESDVALNDIDDDVWTDKVVVVIGAEGAGISRLVAEHCDYLAKIPMQDETESLNAAVAAGIALYAVSCARA